MKLAVLILSSCLLLTLTGDPVTEAWKRIETVVAKDGEESSKLNPPATNEDIDKLQLHLGCKIPQQLRTSLLLHDGMEDLGFEIVDGESAQYFRWLGVEGIRKQWDEDRQRQKEAEAEGDEFLVHPKWIPIFVDPVEHEQVIYLDTSNDSILLRLLPASQEIQSHRYVDLKSFLNVLEHHLRNGLWFEWGDAAETTSVTERECQQ